MTNKLSLVAVVSFLLLGQVVSAQEEIRKGRFSAAMVERSPLSSIKNVCARLGWAYNAVEAQTKAQDQELDYDVARESLEAYVPADYDGKTPYGLLVWVNAGPSGKINEQYLSLLDKHKLIAVGANNDGNSRAVWCRIGVAIDATHHMMKRYKIDPDRVYISGGSGGGRTSSMMGVAFPDLYRGAVPIIGMNFYRALPATNEPGKFWQKTYSPPEPRLFKMTKERTVHVALEGDGDINRFQAKAVIDAYKKDGFKYAYYLEQPNLGHSSPNAEWFEKALDLLASANQQIAEGAKLAAAPVAGVKPTILTKPATDPGVAAEELKSVRELAARDPLAGYEAVQAFIRKYSKSPEVTEALTLSDQLLAKDPKLKKTIEDRTEADKILRVAQIYLQNKLYSKARERLQVIVAQYPQTTSAAEARKILAELPAK